MDNIYSSLNVVMTVFFMVYGLKEGRCEYN